MCESLLRSRGMPFGERSPPARFNVVILYEDPDTRKQAKKGLNYVAEQFGSDFEIRHWMWRLDILSESAGVIQSSVLYLSSS
jgi:hypothetical protein